MKNKLTIYSLLSYISIFLIFFVFTIVLIDSIIAISQISQIMSLYNVSDYDMILVTAFLEFFAAAGCIVLSSFEARKFNKGTFDNIRITYLVYAIFFCYIALSFIFVLPSGTIITAGYISLIILLLLETCFNVFLAFFKNKSKENTRNLFIVVNDGLNLVFAIVVFSNNTNPLPINTLIFSLLIIIILINLIADNINLFNKSLLEKAIGNVTTQEEKPIETKEEQKEDKTE